MRLLTWLLCAAAAVTSTQTSEDRTLVRTKRESTEKRIVCYYTNWSVYRPGSAKFSPQNINPYLCTHLVYAFGGLTKDNSLKPFDKYQDIEQGGYAKFNGLKTYNKKLKTFVAIGGWNEGSARFSPLVADAERRRELVRNVIKFLRQNHFDGLDLDWEYPAFRDGGKPRDRDNYATLVQELREEFNRESEKTGRSRLLLTMAVPAGLDYIDKGYDVQRLNKYLDWMNILSYDYHSAFEPTVNHHAPLFSLEEDDEYNFDAQLSIDATVQHYIKAGADRSKLVLGIPTYGRSYTLFNPDAPEIGAPADGPGEQGDATREKGYLAYYEICEKVKSENWTVVSLNSDAVGPYAYKGNQWVGYDDEKISRAKAKYVNDNDLGGIMFWSIDNDDFRGKCHGKQYPLIEAAKESLLATSNEITGSNKKKKVSGGRRQESDREEKEGKPRNRKVRPKSKTTTTTEAPQKIITPSYTTTTPQPPTTPDPGSDFVCKDEGFFPHPRDCKKYFWCLDSGPSSLGIVAHQFTCPSGLIFNKISDSCDYPRNVVCKNKVETKTTTASTPTTTTTTKSTTANSRIITASPPRSTTTTTTTTEEPEYEEYEDEDEEDPGAIKELLELIKRLGGVEQLEKQLKLQGDTNEKSTIKPSLYNKVLAVRGNANRFRETPESSTPRYTSVFRNRPASPQASPEETQSTKTRNQDKPQYTTIQRRRPTVQTTKDVEEEELEEDDEPVEDKPTNGRRRPGSEQKTQADKQYVTLTRHRPSKVDEPTTSRYHHIQRTRSTTEAVAEEYEDEEEIEDEEVEPVDVKPQRKYSSVIRNNRKHAEEEQEEDLEEEKAKVSEEENSFVNGRAPYRVNNVNSPVRVYQEIKRTRPTTAASSEEAVTVSIESQTSSEETKIPEIQTVQSNVQEVSTKPSVYIVTPETVPSTSEEDRSTESTTFSNLIRRTFKTTVLSRRPKETTTESVTESSPKLKILRRGPSRIRSSTVSAILDDSEEVVKPRTRGTTTTPKPTVDEFKPTNRFKVQQIPDEKSRRRGVIRAKIESTEKPTTERLETSSPKRFQFQPRSKPSIFNKDRTETNSSEFTIVVPETTESLTSAEALTTMMRPDETETTMFDATVTDEFITETNLPVTAAAKRRKIPTSTETRVVTSITESGITEKIKVVVTKKPYLKLPLKSQRTKATTQKTTTTTSTISPRSRARQTFRRPISTESPRRRIPTTESSREQTTEERSRSERTRRGRFNVQSTSTTPATDTSIERTRRGRFNAQSTTTSPATDTSVERTRRGRFNAQSTTTSPVTDTSVERKKFVPQHTRGERKYNDLASTEKVGNSNERFKSRTAASTTEKILSSRRSGRPQLRTKNREDLDTQSSADIYETDEEEFNTGHKEFLLGATVEKSSGDEYLKADLFFVTVPSIEDENNLITTLQDTEIEAKGRSTNPFRGHTKAASSLKSKEDSVEDNEVPTSTVKTTTIHRRGGNSQDYLTNLRSRSRGTTSTTTTERTSTRRTSQLDRRRKFRPEVRATSTTDEPVTDSSQRSTPFRTRKVRPKITTTTTTTTEPSIITLAPDDSRVEESKEASAPELPDLADPAVVAIHNLATATPGPSSRYPGSISSSSAFIATSSPLIAPRVIIPLPGSSPTAGPLVEVTERPKYSTTRGYYTTRPAPNRLSTVQEYSTRNDLVPISRTKGTTITTSKRFQERIVPTEAPITTTTPRKVQTRKLRPFSKVPKAGVVEHVARPVEAVPLDYEYYDDVDPLADVPASALKVKVHSDGYIECLDRGNFPHPFSCKKFISCAKMENNALLGWEYTCPKHLSFDPVGGICNWNAGLGCSH